MFGKFRPLLPNIGKTAWRRKRRHAKRNRRNPLAASDLPDIVRRFRDPSGEAARSRSEQSFFVPKEEIAANGYDLSVNKCKKVAYKAVAYPPSGEILRRLRELEAKISRHLDGLSTR